MESFLAKIQRFIIPCQYCENCVMSIVRDRIVLGVRDSDTQAVLRKKRDLTLKTCIDTCKAAENVNSQVLSLRPETVNKLQLGAIQMQRRNDIKGKFQEIATNKNENANTGTINTERRRKNVPRTETFVTCAIKRTTLLSGVPRKTMKELTRESILLLTTLQVRSGFIPSTTLRAYGF